MGRELSFYRILPVLFAVSGMILQSCGQEAKDTLFPWDSTGGGTPSRYSEGTSKTPVSLAADGSAHEGGVDRSSASYYTFTTAGGSYIISIQGLSEPTDTLLWSVYSNDFYNGPVSGGKCNHGGGITSITGAITCAVPDLPAGTYCLLVSNYGLKDTTYSISVAPDTSGGYINAPAQLAIGTTYDETLYANGYDYYYFVVPQGGSGAYRIDLSSTNADMGWKFYSGSTYATSLLTCDAVSTEGMESCATSNLDHGTYYVKVFSRSALPETHPYTITVTTQGSSEGTVNEPVALTAGASHAGRISPSGGWSNPVQSYYSFTPDQNMAYLITLTGISTVASPGLSWTLYSAADFSAGKLGTCWERTFSGEVICRTPAKLAANSTYYLAVTNEDGPSNTYTITITPYDVSFGCNGVNTKCYDFENGIDDLHNNLNNATFPWPSRAPWALTSSAGTGTQGFTSTEPNGNWFSYDSCFMLTATDVKWIGYSLQTTMSSVGTYGTLEIWLEDFLRTSQPQSPDAWGRFVYIPSSGGLHSYEWCYDSNSSGDAAWLDDIELHY